MPAPVRRRPFGPHALFRARSVNGSKASVGRTCKTHTYRLTRSVDKYRIEFERSDFRKDPVVTFQERLSTGANTRVDNIPTAVDAELIRGCTGGAAVQFQWRLKVLHRNGNERLGESANWPQLL